MDEASYREWQRLVLLRRAEWEAHQRAKFEAQLHEQASELEEFLHAMNRDATRSWLEPGMFDIPGTPAPLSMKPDEVLTWNDERDDDDEAILPPILRELCEHLGRSIWLDEQGNAHGGGDTLEGTVAWLQARGLDVATIGQICAWLGDHGAQSDLEVYLGDVGKGEARFIVQAIEDANRRSDQ